MLGSFLGAKVGAALAVGAMSFGGLSAAAYTGVLPSGLQDLAHTTVGAPAADESQTADVGETADVEEPEATKKAADPKTADATKADTKKAADAKKAKDTTTAGVGPDATGPAAFGLCNAWQHVKTHGQAVKKSVAFRNLATAAGGAESIGGYCATITHPGASTSMKIHPIVKPSNHPSGKPSSHPTGKPSSHPTRR